MSEHYRSGRPNYGCTSSRAIKEGHERNSAGVCALCGDGPAAPIAAQLDQDAKRAAFEAWCKTAKHPEGGYRLDRIPSGAYVHPETRCAFWGWRGARSTPAAAQLDAELPPLLDKVAADIELYAESYDMMERMNGGGNKVSCTCVAVDLRQNIIPQVQKRFAPYAERIRLLERELEAARQVGKHLFTAVAESSVKQPAQSIDTPEFVKLEAAYVKALYEYPDAPSMKRADALTAARRALIAYIDGRTAPRVAAPIAWMIKTGHGNHWRTTAPTGEFSDKWIPLIDGRTAGTASDAAPADPMDWPLPCDIAVGNGTIRKGCKLRTLVTRMESLQRMAVAALPKLTPEQQRENWDELFAAAAPSPQENTK